MKLRSSEESLKYKWAAVGKRSAAERGLGAEPQRSTMKVEKK